MNSLTDRHRAEVSTSTQLRAPLPERIETERLLLRCWRPEDAPWLKDAIDSSLAELKTWMVWATHEPSSIEVLAERLRGFRDDFRAGRSWTYGIFDRADTQVVGGAGLHARGGPGVLEIGYWIRTDATRHGYATEAAATLTAVAFEFAAIARVEIRCDPRNLRSAAIPGGSAITTPPRCSPTHGHRPARPVIPWYGS